MMADILVNEDGIAQETIKTVQDKVSWAQQYGINPFDQPGIKEEKRSDYGMMNRPGFDEKKEVTTMINKRNPKYLTENA